MSEPKRTLAEEMGLLFDADEDVKEMILLGKLPPDIAQIAADALEKKSDTPASRPISLGSTEPYMHIAGLIQRRFWPNAPDVKRGGFMSMLSGKGPAPAWVIVMQVASQITDKARECGYDVPESEGELAARELDKLRESEGKPKGKLTDLSPEELEQKVKELETSHKEVIDVTAKEIEKIEGKDAD